MTWATLHDLRWNTMAETFAYVDAWGWLHWDGLALGNWTQRGSHAS